MCLFLWASIGHAQNTISGTVFDINSNQVLPGASVFWEVTTVGTSSDVNGEFEINLTQQHKMLSVSFVWYQQKTFDVDVADRPLRIYLSPDTELDAVNVVEKQQGIYMSKASPIQQYTVTGAELCKAACCNLSESFETNASVDVSYSDATTGAKQIRMLGLSGRYVQMLAENMPTIRGLASSYGLGYIPGPWMESIQVSKGTASVKNGYEAMTGQINVEYKKPDANERFHLNLFGSDAMKTEFNLNGSIKFSDSVSTMLLVHGENQSKEIDHNGDLFMDLPNVKQMNLINRWNIIGENGYRGRFLVKALQETRRSGQIAAFDDPGNNMYGIEIATKRLEFSAKNGFIFQKPGTSLGTQLSGSFHEHQSFYGDQIYDATQYSAYFNLIYQNSYNPMHEYNTGFSVVVDRFNESLNAMLLDRIEIVPGAFFEYTYKPTHRFVALMGLRADYSTIHGAFVTPRLHLKYNPSDIFHIRGTVGKGYRSANPLAEHNYLLGSSREMVIDEEFKMEEALNVGINLTADIPIGEQNLSLSADYYHTRFLEQVVVDMDRDAHKAYFTNLEGKSYSNALQFEASTNPIDGLSLLAAFRITDVKQTLAGELQQVPLTSKYKGLLTGSYSTRLNKWQFDATLQLNGGGRMPTPDALNPLWEETYPSFETVNAQITRRFRLWEVYVGAENIFNYTIPNPIIDAGNPWGDNFDGSMAWGPIHGRKIYIGLRFTIEEL